MTNVWCESAVVDGRSQPGVSIEITDGRFSAITTRAEPGNATRLAGFTIPGMANAHSHAFHRLLRSRTQTDRGTFWTWRDLMYRATERLEPESYHRLARAVFGEMALAGITCVGEFHYLHHQLDGTPYGDPNEMGMAMLAAADDAGIRITLLDTLYLHGGLDGNGYSPATGPQRRFADASVDAWGERVDQLDAAETQRIGAAIHSVRAVAPSDIRNLADWASNANVPVHAHVSEQAAENEACLAHLGSTPTQALADAGVLTDRFSAVHATHLDAVDITSLAKNGATVAMCPTTERDLGDGIGPTREFAESGVPIALGSDSHATIDLLVEARSVELHERLRSQQRGIHSAVDLLAMATASGHRSLGWPDAGTIAVGNRADLVTVALDSVRTAGTELSGLVETAVFAATAADITDVHVDGRHIVKDRRHVDLDVAAELDASIRELMDNV